MTISRIIITTIVIVIIVFLVFQNQRYVISFPSEQKAVGRISIYCQFKWHPCTIFSSDSSDSLSALHAAWRGANDWRSNCDGAALALAVVGSEVRDSLGMRYELLLRWGQRGSEWEIFFSWTRLCLANNSLGSFCLGPTRVARPSECCEYVDHKRQGGEGVTTRLSCSDLWNQWYIEVKSECIHLNYSHTHVAAC